MHPSRFHVLPTVALILGVTSLSVSDTLAGDNWMALGGGPQRISLVDDSLPDITKVKWTATCEFQGQPLHFVGQAAVVASDSLIYAPAEDRSVPSVPALRLCALQRQNGLPVWTAALPSSQINLNSFSSACLDESRGTILFASANFLTAFNAQTGAIVWSRQLAYQVVNASPMITNDRPSRNRVFITDFELAENKSSLYCINIDPFNAALNPYLPGEVVWQSDLGRAVGNSVSYLPVSKGGTDLVYVATIGDASGEDQPGLIRAFRINDLDAESPFWTTPNPQGHGFFGGVAITAACQGVPSYLYAASYAFGSGLDNANLVKLNALTGELIWSVPSNRTDSIPIPLDDGRILLSTGIPGFGSSVSLQLFEDHGTYATRLWDSAESTWTDLNDNGVIDTGEYIRLGGWSHQPLVSQRLGKTFVLCGAIPASQNQFAPNSELYILDLDYPPSNPSFFVSSFNQAGGTPAFADELAFTIGPSGLFALGRVSPRFDVNLDFVVSIEDLYTWEGQRGARDVDRDGATSSEDRALLIRELRSKEVQDLESHR